MDLIDRQAAIRSVVQTAAKKELDVEAIASVIDTLEHIPSAEPVIRCKDCKHSEHWYRDKRRCFLWHEEGIDVFDDGYCNYAERRTDG